MTDCFRPRDNGDRGGGFLALVFQSSDGDGGGGDAGGVLQSFARNLKVREISSKIDLDVMGRNFGRFAGGNMMMDAEEFDRFTKSTNLTRAQAASLWDILDADRSAIAPNACTPTRAPIARSAMRTAPTAPRMPSAPRAGPTTLRATPWAPTMLRTLRRR